MIDDLLQEAEREQRRELETQARSAIELRACLPEIVRETVATILEEADDLEHARELAGLETTENDSEAGPLREEWLIDGKQLPVEQVDRIDGDLVVSTGVTTAIGHGFDFANIWRHNTVEIEKNDGTFTATIVACEIEHGMAAIRLTDMGDESDGGDR